MTTLITVIDLLISLGVLSLAFFVLSQNPDRKINQIYGLTIFFFASWIISSSLSDITGFWGLERGALFWARAAIVGPFLFCPMFLYFTYFFPQENNPSAGWKLIAIFLLPVVSLIFAPTKYNVESVTLESWGTGFTPGYLYLALLICLVFYFGFGLYRLARSYRIVKFDHERGQIFYVFVGVISFVVVGIVTNIVLPIYGIAQLSIIGPSLAMLIFGTLTAYAILVHHLLDVWVVVRLGAIFTLVFAIIGFIYVAGVGILSQYIGGIASLLITSLLVTLSFESLKKFIEEKTDKIFFRKHYRTEEVIEELTSVVHKLELSTDKIISVFNGVIKKYFKVERTAVAIMTPQKFSGFAADGVIEKINLCSDNPIAQFISANPDFIFNSQELEKSWRGREIDLSVEKIELLPKVFEEMEKMGFVLAMPFSEDGKLIGICFVGGKKSGDWFTIQDIQLLKHLTGEIGIFLNNAYLYEDLKKLDEAKSNFLSVVSHQLRTPLSAMRWSTELLLSGEVDQRRQKEFLNDIYKDSIFMIYHLDDMLTALDIEDKEIKIRKESCDLRGLVREVLDDNAQLIKFKNLDMETDFAGQDDVACDYKKIKKIFEVLISNSINYAPSRSMISIKGKEKFIDEVRWLDISISDSGIGISKDEEEYLFQKFYRGETAKKLSPNGFGLGLFIVKSFIKAHGGEIYFESAGRNRGCKFYFSIPCD